MYRNKIIDNLEKWTSYYPNKEVSGSFYDCMKLSKEEINKIVSNDTILKLDEFRKDHHSFKNIQSIREEDPLKAGKLEHVKRENYNNFFKKYPYLRNQKDSVSLDKRAIEHIVEEGKKLEKYEKVKNLIENAENKIENYFESAENIKEYLKFMSKFHNYSFRNSILIQEQFKGADAVGSFAFWKKENFQVNKKEKGIKILVPQKGKDRFENEKGEIKAVDKANEAEKKAIKEGKFEVIKGKTYFIQGYVFDISQTNATAKDLPKIFPNKWLDGKVDNYDVLRKGMEKIAEEIGVKILETSEELGAVKGRSYPESKKVVLNKRNSQLQNVKTLLHELTHAKLHTMDKLDNYAKHEKEFQAELTAYAVCAHFGIDTSEYSMKYISDWTQNKTLEDKKELLKEVHETATHYINVLEETLIQEKDKNISNEVSTIEIEDNKDIVTQMLSKEPEALKIYEEKKENGDFKINNINQKLEQDIVM